MPVAFWLEFAILLMAALVGAAAVIPYGLRMAPTKRPRPALPVILLLTLVQNAILFSLAIGLGLLAAHAVGFGVPYLEAGLTGARIPPAGGLVTGVLVGAAAGVVLFGADLLFVPHWPPPVRDLALKSTIPDNLLASLYGGINEELLMRLFGLSGLVWLMSLLWRTLDGAPHAAALWVANIIMTILFGLGHLPALAQMLGRLPRLMIARSLLLNAPIGLACGWLFWTFGLEAAMLAHFSADIVYHVFGSWFMRRRLA